MKANNGRNGKEVLWAKKWDCHAMKTKRGAAMYVLSEINEYGFSLIEEYVPAHY